MENMTSKELHKHQEIGFLEVLTTELIGSKSTYTSPLTSQKSSKNAGMISITIDKVNVKSLKETVNLCIAAQKLSKKKLFGRCDCFFELSRTTCSGSYQPVYRSEIVNRNTEPRWRPFQISLQKLCNGDRSCSLSISVWNYRHKGDHELLGMCQTSLDKLLKSAGGVKLLPVVKQEQNKFFSVSKLGSGNKTNLSMAGAVQIMQCHVNEQFSLLDYVKGGCRIHFAAAVDFSFSNGNPMEQDSLHYVGDDKSNVYADAMYEVGSLLAYYEIKQILPLFGFGANLEDNSDEACFQILSNNNTPSSIGNGVLELVEKYKSVLPRIQPKGPTYFTPLLRHFTKGLNEVAQESGQTFTFGLILTDGVCNDEEEFIAELVKMRHLPFSIVIVGVGLLDCLSLEVLAEKVRKKAKRSVVYFIPFRQPQTGLYNSHQVKCTYAQLSKDTVNYFKERSIKPGNDDSFVKQFPWAEKILNSNYNEPITDAMETNRVNSFVERTSFCPTCGNHSPINF